MFTRRCRYCSVIVFSGILLALVGCGAIVSSQAPGTASPASTATTPTGTPASTATTPTGTPASQAITITTDRLTYAGSDVIRVTVTNHTGATVYASPGHASCTILSLEMLVNGQWQTSDAASCPTQPAQALVPLRPNIPYQGAIRGLALPYRPHPFPAGTYRLAIAYWQSITGAIPGPKDSNAIVSASFTIQ